MVFGVMGVPIAVRRLAADPESSTDLCLRGTSGSGLVSARASMSAATTICPVAATSDCPQMATSSRAVAAVLRRIAKRTVDLARRWTRRRRCSAWQF